MLVTQEPGRPDLSRFPGSCITCSHNYTERRRNKLIIIVTLLVAAAGGALSMRLKLPAGTFFGALIATAVFSLLTGMAYIPRTLRVTIQLFTGTYLGAAITKSDIFGLRKLAKPALLLSAGIALVVGLMSFIMRYAGGLDTVTSLLVCAPGGMADMVLISDDLGANTTQVVVLHLVRVLFIFIAVPAILRKRFLGSARRHQTPKPDVSAPDVSAVSAFNKPKIAGILMTAAAGTVTGLIFWRFGIKAGALLGGMLGAAVFNIITNRAYFPRYVKIPLRVVTGAYIGQQITVGSFLLMRTLLIPVLAQCGMVLMFLYVVARFVTGYGKLDGITGAVSCMPGGLQEMVLLAEDLGADVPKVVLLQTMRQTAILIFIPLLIAVFV